MWIKCKALLFSLLAITRQITKTFSLASWFLILITIILNIGKANNLTLSLEQRRQVLLCNWSRYYCSSCETIITISLVTTEVMHCISDLESWNYLKNYIYVFLHLKQSHWCRNYRRVMFTYLPKRVSLCK